MDNILNIPFRNGKYNTLVRTFALHICMIILMLKTNQTTCNCHMYKNINSSHILKPENSVIIYVIIQMLVCTMIYYGNIFSENTDEH